MSVQKFRDIHKGKICYIAGCGVTLLSVDKKDVENGVLICINESLLYFDKADYFFATDMAIRNEQAVKIAREKVKDVIVCEDLCGSNNYFQMEETHFHCLQRQKHWQWKLSADATNLIKGNDAVQCAVHLAVIMGCSQIVLLGCDCKMIDGKYYFWETEPSKRPMTSLNLSKAGWREIAQHNSTLELYNASPDSDMVGIKRKSLNYFTQPHKIESK